MLRLRRAGRTPLKKFEGYIDEAEKSWFTIDIGLLVRLVVVFATRQSRFRTVASISVGQLEASWAKAQQGLNFAINFLRSNAGIEDESLLSSAFLMIPLAVYGVLKGDEISLDEQRDVLRWLYVANYRGHYSGSSETTLDADLGVLFRHGSFKELLEPLLTKFGRLHVEAGDFRGRGERSPLFSIAYLALKNAGATDWITGLGLSLRHQGQLQYIEYHHIFPKSLLREAYDKAEINEIANMAFISSKANREISNKEPTKYLRTITQKRGEEALSNQAITLDEKLWELGRFRDFLEDRRAGLATAVNRFVEASVAEGKAAAIDPTSN